MLQYKLRTSEKLLIKINRYYASSKTCSVCGNVKEQLLLGERIYKCDKCGASLDRDKNAAINIEKEGLRMINSW